MRLVIAGIIVFEAIIVIGGIIQGNTLEESVQLVFWTTLVIAVWLGIFYVGVRFVRGLIKPTEKK